MKKILFLFVILVYQPQAYAALIYDNGAVVDNGFGSDADFGALPLFIADDFVLQAGASTITDIHWTGLYGLQGSPQALDAFTIEVYADAGGAPSVGPALHTLDIGHVGRTATGGAILGYAIYSYAVDIAPIALDAGVTYWLSIFNDTTVDTNDSWYWGGQNDVGNRASRRGQSEPWVGNTDRLDFQLTSDGLQPIPAPATLLLVAVGLLGLGGLRQINGFATGA